MTVTSKKKGTNLLVGEAVERTSKAVHGGGEGEERIRESGAHQVAGVGRHVTSFVVTVRVIIIKISFFRIFF